MEEKRRHKKEDPRVAADGPELLDALRVECLQRAVPADAALLRPGNGGSVPRAASGVRISRFER